MGEAARLFVTVGASTGAFESAMGRVEARGRSTARAMSRAGKVTALGFAGALAISAATAASFERKMQAVKAVTGASKANLDRLAAAAKALGASQQYGARGARAVADAEVELGKAGLTTAQIIGGGLRAALSLASAGSLSVAEAASYTANAMNLFALRARDAGQVADALATAANVTTADVGDFGMALTQGGSAAKAAGLSFNETMTALTALAKAGIKGSDAGTSLKTSLLQLINPTAKQAKAAQAAGLSFVDQAGKMRSLVDISGQLRRATQNKSQADRLALFATLAGTDGVRTLLSLYQAGPAALQRWSRQLAQSGSAARTARTMNTGAAASFDRLKAVVENLAIDVGTALLPSLTDGAQAVAAFLGSAMQGEQFKTFLGDIGSLASTAFTTLGSAAQTVGPILVTVAGAIRAIAQSPAGPAILGLVAAFMGFSKVVAMVTAVKAALVGLGTSAATPLGAIQLLVAATAGLAFALSSIQSVSAEAAAEQNAFAAALRNAASAANAAKNAASQQADAMLQIRQGNQQVATAEQQLAAAKRQVAAVRARAITDTYTEAQRSRDLEQALGRQRTAQLQVDQSRRQVNQGVQQSLQALRTENSEVRKRLGTLQSQTQLEQRGAKITQQLSQLSGADAATRRAATAQVGRYTGALRATLSAQQQAASSYRSMAQRARDAASSIQGNSSAAKAARSAHLNLARGFDAAAGRASAAAGRTAALAAAFVDSAGAASGAQGPLGGFGGAAAGAGGQAGAAASKVRDLASAIASINSKSITISVTVVKTAIEQVRRIVSEATAGAGGGGHKSSKGEKGRSGPKPNQAERLAIADSQIALREARAQLADVMRRRKAKKKADRSTALEVARARLGVTQARVAVGQAQAAPAARARQALATRNQTRAQQIRDANQGIAQALSTNYLSKFDEQASAKLDAIRAKYEDGVTKIGDTFQVIPGIFSQIEQRTKAQTDAVQAALKGELDGIEAKYAGMFKDLEAEQKTAGKALEAKYRQLGKDLEAQAAVLTPAEAMLKSLDDAMSAKDTLYEVTDAEAALREAIQKQMPEAEVRDRMRAVERARYQEQRAGLEQQASAEREAANAKLEQMRQDLADQQEAEQEASDAAFEQRRANLEAQQQQETDAANERAAAQTAAIEAAGAAERAWQEQQLAAETAHQEEVNATQRAALERRLNQLGANFIDMRAMNDGNFRTMIAQANWFAEALGASGQTAGEMLATGLRGKLPRIRDAAKEVADELRKYLELHSPAEKGPLSDINRWWEAMPATLSDGIRAADMERAAASAAASAADAGGSYRGRAAAGVVVNINLSGNTMLSSDRRTADELARIIEPALGRLVRLSV